MTDAPTIAKGLTEYDKRVLLTMYDSKDRIQGWGAWVGEVKSDLRRNRLAVMSGNTLILTDLGRAVAAELEGEMRPQLPGFDRPKRKPPRVMAKLYDAGGESEPMACFKCKKCGWDSDWIVDRRSVSEIKRGFPCPDCNGDRP